MLELIFSILLLCWFGVVIGVLERMVPERVMKWLMVHIGRWKDDRM